MKMVLTAEKVGDLFKVEIKSDAEGSDVLVYSFTTEKKMNEFMPYAYGVFDEMVIIPVEPPVEPPPEESPA